MLAIWAVIQGHHTSADQATFRSAVEIVTVHATVRSRTGRLVPGLSKADFSLTVDGKATEIATFANEPRDVVAALMIDTSDSMAGRLRWARESAQAFINALGPRDRASIGTFGWEVVVNPNLTADKAVLRRVLDEELWPGGHTPLWEAVQLSITSLEKETGRRAVVAISDGGGSASVPKEVAIAPRLLDRALSSGVIVYTVGAKETGLGLLKEISEKTGGGYSSMNSADRSGQVMRDVVAELRAEYLIGFVSPTKDGREHTMAVKSGRADFTVIAPSKFTAPK